jgi:hypothetical protein
LKCTSFFSSLFIVSSWSPFFWLVLCQAHVCSTVRQWHRVCKVPSEGCVGWQRSLWHFPVMMRQTGKGTHHAPKDISPLVANEAILLLVYLTRVGVWRG